MIRRFLCLSLIPLILANQGLCMAHAHHGNDMAEPEHQAQRPHIHIGGHGEDVSTAHHSDHSHSDHPRHVRGSDEYDAALPSAVVPVGEHDSDAVYCAESVNLARVAESVLPAKNVTVSVIFHVAHQSEGLPRLGRLPGQPPSLFVAACPIYLRTLSLRI